LKPFERRAEDVLHDHEPAIGRQHDPVGRERAVRHTASLLLQRGQRRHEIPNQPHRKCRPAQGGQPLREPLSRHVIGDQRQIVFGLEFFHRPHFGKRRVPELRKDLHALAERLLETGDRGDFPGKSQELEGRAAGVVEHQKAIAHRIRHALRVPTGAAQLRVRRILRVVDAHFLSAPVFHE
jgi:hypothetical protein